MIKEAGGRLGIDFPLADFLSEAPNKAFLTGVTAGRIVDIVTIDGARMIPCSFPNHPASNSSCGCQKRAIVPRRLIVTYRSLPGQPNLIAEFSDWNFNIPADAEFPFQPAGAEQKALKPATAPAPATKGGM